MSRSLLDAETSLPVTEVKQGQLLKVRLSVSSLEPRAHRGTGRAPAGFRGDRHALKTATQSAGTDSDYVWNWREPTTSASRSLPTGCLREPGAGAPVPSDPKRHFVTACSRRGNVRPYGLGVLDIPDSGRPIAIEWIDKPSHGY
ncbi:MAG: hypothetical protein R3B07_14050 [Polyangiaceae bacterium]